MMTYGSLFSGVGGMDLGFERAGFNCRWACEIDPHAAGVFMKHWPKVKQYADVGKLEKPEPVDLIIYGFPCTDLSRAGKQIGLQGKRSGLFFQALRLIRGIAPRIAVFENVPGLLSSNDGSDFLSVLESLAGIGYRTLWVTLDSRWFGVAQRRRRVFGISTRDTESGLIERIALALQALPEGLSGDLVPVGEGRQTASSNTEKGFGSTVMAVLESPTNGVSLAEYTWPLAGGGGKPGQGYQAVLETSVFRKSARARSADGFETWVDDGVANTLSGFENHNDMRTTHAVVQEMVVRRLLPVECERLQGWPDDHTRFKSILKLEDNVWIDTGKIEEQKDGQRYKQCGNGVTAPVAEFLARLLCKVTPSGV
jgi:DNA-cytosine methyltransferase